MLEDDLIICSGFCFLLGQCCRQLKLVDRHGLAIHYPEPFFKNTEHIPIAQAIGSSGYFLLTSTLPSVVDLSSEHVYEGGYKSTMFAASAGFEHLVCMPLIKAGAMGCNVQFWASTDTYSHQLGSLLDEAMCIRECTRQPIKMCEVQSLVLSGLHVVDVVCPCRCSKGEKPYATCSGRAARLEAAF